MGNLHRVQWIDQRIRAGQYPNCTAIAAQFEISRRQAARDVEYLRDSLGAPIDYSAKHNGYQYTASDFRLPQLALSVEDKDTLRTLSVQYARAGSQNARRLATLFEKLSQAGDVPTRENPSDSATQDLLPPDGDDSLLLLYRQLDLAFQLRRKVNMTYMDARHRTTHRIVRPYLLFMKQQTPYLVAHCEMRQQTRVFSIKRIQQVETQRAGYVIPDSFHPDAYVATTTHVNRHPYMACVLFPDGMRIQPYPLQVPPPPDRSWQVLSQADGALQDLDQPDGSRTFLFHQSEVFLSWLLSHPPGYQLLRPSWLRERLVNRLNELLDAHRYREKE